MLTLRTSSLHSTVDRMLPDEDIVEQTADFLIRSTGRPDPMVIELGVGTGRIALPLARRGAVVTGVDVSPTMLAACRAATGPADPEVRLIEADMREWQPPWQADLVYSVCGTLTYLTTVADQCRAMRVLASAVRPGGTVIIENSNPDFVRSVHDRRRSIALKLPLGRVPDRVDARSSLDEAERIWRREYRWTDAAGRAVGAVERTLLTDPDDVIDMAAEVGLSWQSTHGDWTGSPLHPRSRNYVCVFSAPDISDAA